MTLLALLLTIVVPAQAQPVPGWIITPAGPTQPIIGASRTVASGLTLTYSVHDANVRAINVSMANCGAERGFDTPADAPARQRQVVETLSAMLASAKEKCGLRDATLADVAKDFAKVYPEVEKLAAARPAPLAATGRNEVVAGWKLADVNEDGERKLRMRKSVGEADIEYRVMAGVDRRLNLMVGGCGGNAMIDLPEATPARAAAAKAQLAELITNTAADCKIDKATQAALAAGFDQAFAAIEGWARDRPVTGGY